MRFLTADILFTAKNSPLKNGVVVVNDTGLILDILDLSKVQPDLLEYFPGALCPGFINTHCHLELSHLFQEIDKHTGLPKFIKSIVSKRNFPEDKILECIDSADKTMYNNGIVAVGDISNTSLSFSTKEDSHIFYHTFIELFASLSEKANPVFQNGYDLLNQCQHSSSLVPHSTYSVSDKLFQLIKSNNAGEIVSIHNQETADEDEMFLNGEGNLLKVLNDKSDFKSTGLSALKSTLPKLPNSPILFVHNTFTSQADIQFAMSQKNDVYWATCPKANLYIEKKLPDYQIFINQNAKMTIGTDSLASNDTLCLLEEMKVINHTVSLEILLQWACKNGAEFLGLNQMGTLEKGKSPGINHISHLRNEQLTERSSVNRII
ncbi:MAG: amidohydrolase family protein [Flavobacteriales bacterium]